MKRIFYLLIFVLALNINSNAQSFTMQKDTVNSLMQSYLFDQYNYVRNMTNDTIRVSWKVFAHNLPQDWIDNGNYGLCDNQLCYLKNILTGTTQTTLPIDAGDSSVFKGQFDGSSAQVTTTGVYYYAVELSHNTTKDTAVFTIGKWPASVSSVNGSTEKVLVYPNPAKNDLNVVFDKSMNVRNIAIYNLVGKQVSNFKVTGNSGAKLDIEKIPSGVYFLRLIDNSGRVTATRRFTHQ